MHVSCCVLFPQGLAAQQGISWDDIKRAAEASQHAAQVAAQQAQQPQAAAGEFCPTVALQS
jgi:hypothetical protein